MAYDEQLANRVREALADMPQVEEKIMFKGICFMVDGKMCVCVSGEELMCRIDPALYDELIEKPGVREMEMKGKIMKGYVYVSPDVIKTNKDFRYWIDLCLAFNKHAKASAKKPKKTAAKE
ncbi:MAG: TfoX family protein [Sphingobacteriales bacterium]|nr:MAG: TfoX family protein [Sphingobacteriales bacterium]